jgi:hypothetical protein
VVEKAAWKNGALQAALFEPFKILRHSNQESYRKEKEKSGSGRELGVWLTERNPLHNQKQRICERIGAPHHRVT